MLLVTIPPLVAVRFVLELFEILYTFMVEILFEDWLDLNLT